MKKVPEKLDNSYLAAPVINNCTDLLDALVASKKVYEDRKERLDKFAKKNPDSPLLALLDYELLCDANLFNLAEKLIENTQYVEGKLQAEFTYLKDWLLQEQQANITLFEENAKLRFQLKKVA